MPAVLGAVTGAVAETGAEGKRRRRR